MASGEGINTISLVSSQSSKITNVNLYSGRAEVTRQFIFPVKKGQNQVVILGLPSSLQEDTVRVEGRGQASIQDVAISRTPQDQFIVQHERSVAHAASPLARRREETKKAIQSAEEARRALTTYLATVKANEVGADMFAAILDGHETLARKFDLRILDLEKELSELTLQAGIEKLKASENVAQQQTWQIAVNLWAEAGEDVEINIQYVVTNADWSASYDIRADTAKQGKNITISYKAVITQNTGESWEGVPLTLETTNPTFGLNSPELPPWNVDVFSPGPTIQPHMAHIPAMPQVITMDRWSRRSRSRSRSRSPRRISRRHRSRSRSWSPEATRRQAMSRMLVASSNKGGVAATFEIPGYISVPSDALKHNVTIATLEFEAPLLWYTIPKVDAKIYMKAKIKNESEYMFIPGPANVYVDKSFIATTTMSAVSPEETFDCSLGLDRSIRVTYHPLEKKATQTGFVKKSSSTTYTHRITLANTKSTAIKSLKVVDSIPVSQDERIEIKLLSPSLPPPSPDALARKESTAADGDGDSQGSSTKGTTKMASSRQKIMRVLSLPSQSAKGNIVAQWDGIDDLEVDQQTVGKNGRVNWIVSLAPQESVTLALKYEVSFPERLPVYGL
ncbi:hypothetical protein BJ912DRAFT_1020342 [Pholiota molesta]|nr:hypothetical protein BJ912DRAFT_1020342 [Pholiota molesta]